MKNNKEVKEKKDKFNFKIAFLKPLGIALEILVIQSAITLVLSLLLVMFYNYERIFLLSIIPGLIGSYVIKRKYKKKSKTPLSSNLRLRITSIFILLNLIIFYFFSDRTTFYEPLLIFLTIIIEIIFGVLVYYILGMKKY